MAVTAYPNAITQISNTEWQRMSLAQNPDAVTTGLVVTSIGTGSNPKVRVSIGWGTFGGFVLDNTGGSTADVDVAPNAGGTARTDILVVRLSWLAGQPATFSFAAKLGTTSLTKQLGAGATSPNIYEFELARWTALTGGAGITGLSNSHSSWAFYSATISVAAQAGIFGSGIGAYNPGAFSWDSTQSIGKVGEPIGLGDLDLPAGWVCSIEAQFYFPNSGNGMPNALFKMYRNDGYMLDRLRSGPEASPNAQDFLKLSATVPQPVFPRISFNMTNPTNAAVTVTTTLVVSKVRQIPS